MLGEYSPGLDALPAAYGASDADTRARMLLMVMSTDGLRYRQLRGQALHCAASAEAARLRLLAAMPGGGQ